MGKKYSLGEDSAIRLFMADHTSQLMASWGETKLFQDNTYINRLTPPSLQRRIARYNIERDAQNMYIGDDATIGPLCVNHEIYKGGFIDTKSGLSVRPGESCLALHLLKGGQSGLIFEYSRLLLRGVSYFLDQLPRNLQPKYVTGLTYRQLAIAAEYMGFKRVEASNTISAYYRLLVSEVLRDIRKDMEATQQAKGVATEKAARLRNRRGVEDKQWVVYMSTDEFRQRFPTPPGITHDPNKYGIHLSLDQLLPDEKY